MDCCVLVGSVWHTVGSWNNNESCLSWFPAHNGLADMDTLVLLVGMCVVGLLFENYIVNASIFYKKAISLRK